MAQVRKTATSHKTSWLIWVGIAAGVVVVALLAYYWLLHHDTRSTSATPTNPVGTSSTTQPLVDGATEQPVTKRVFKIPELGIQMTLPEGLEGLEYIVQKSSDGNTMIVFGSKELNQKNDDQSYCTTASAPLGYIVKYKAQSDADSRVSGPTRVVNLDGYNFAYYHPQQSCTANESLGNLQDQQTRILQEAINSISIVK